MSPHRFDRVQEERTCSGAVEGRHELEGRGEGSGQLCEMLEGLAVDVAVESGVAPLPVVAEIAGEPFEPTGSNGIAIAPSNTVDGNALLLINPHTSFFFRHEAHVTSDEGLNAYGALTWGQFFIYQGFNETAGWMHTSSSVDNIDEFLETNERCKHTIETVFLMAEAQHQAIASKLVKEIARLQGDVSKFVTPLVNEELLKRFGETIKA